MATATTPAHELLLSSGEKRRSFCTKECQEGIPSFKPRKWALTRKEPLFMLVLAIEAPAADCAGISTEMELCVHNSTLGQDFGVCNAILVVI